MEKTADAVVIGGGIQGASVGHFLAKKGFGKVVLLGEKDPCGREHGTLRSRRPQHLLEFGDGEARLARRADV